MNNELIPFADTSVQLNLDWDATIAETKALIAEDAALEKQQQEILMRRFEIRVQVGFNLLALQSERAKQKSGDFSTFAIEEFSISKTTIYDCMHVAERLGNKVHGRVLYPWEVWRELARPSTPDVVIEQVETGEIEANPKAIREAKEALKKAEEAERKAKEQAQSAQQQLFAVQSQSQTRITELTQQIASLQGEMQELTTPEVRIERVEVIPTATTQKLQTLQEQINRLTYERNNETKRADSFAQKYQEDMTEREEAKNHERIRQNWRSIVSQTHSTLMRLLAQWPTPVDTQSFEADDWAHVDHLKNTLRRVQEECNNLYSREDDMIIDATR